MEEINMEKRNQKTPGHGSVANKISELQSKAETEPIAAFLGMRLIDLSEGGNEAAT
jgi:hypothetical protein